MIRTFTKRTVIIVGVTAALLTLYKFITKKYKKHLPNIPPPIYICSDSSDWNLKEKDIKKHFYAAEVIGLDCEWITIGNNRNPIALLQLASVDGFCVLVRLCKISPWLIPNGLHELLSDAKILKVGVGIYEDAQKLFHDYGFVINGCLDLRYIAQDRPEFQNTNNLGLQTLSLKVLEVPLKKLKSVTCSNWEADVLTPQQVAYAAEDALAAAQIYSKLSEDECVNTGTMSTIKKYEYFIDMPYKQTKQHFQSDSEHKEADGLSQMKKTFRRYQVRQRPMYENCQLQAPDGEPLCTCDRKKAEWYLHKGRGEIICENPFIVRLNFEPSGRPILDNKYYLMEKENCCVVCGAKEHFFRKLIVPSEYRHYFPDIMKKNLSHDVLLLCVNCHRKSNILDQKLREQLAEECNAPITSGRNIKVKINGELQYVKSAARALLKSGDKIPQSRKEQLLKVLEKHYNVSEITEEMLEEASNFNLWTENEDYEPHGLKVCQYMGKHEGLVAFEIRWRKHFLDTMQPKFLPVMWSIDHNHERLALQVLKNKVDFDVSVLGLSPELLDKVRNMLSDE